VRSLIVLTRASVAVFVLAVMGAVPAAAAPSANHHEPSPRREAVSVSNPSPTRDGTIDVFSSGWEPGSAVVIALGDTELRTVPADAGGRVRADVRIPRDAPSGFGVLSVTGAGATGVPQQIVTGLSVVSDHAPATESTRPWVAISLVLTFAIVFLLLGMRAEEQEARLADSG
jgi:hypothetical protein